MYSDAILPVHELGWESVVQNLYQIGCALVKIIIYHYQLDLKYSRMITLTVIAQASEEPHSEDEQRLKLRSSGMDKYPTSALPFSLESILLCTLTHSSAVHTFSCPDSNHALLVTSSASVQCG